MMVLELMIQVGGCEYIYYIMRSLLNNSNETTTANYYGLDDDTPDAPAPAAAPAAESSAPQLTDAQKQFFGL